MTTDLDGRVAMSEHEVVTEARRLQGAHGARLMVAVARALRQAAGRLGHAPVVGTAGRLRLH